MRRSFVRLTVRSVLLLWVTGFIVIGAYSLNRSFDEERAPYRSNLEHPSGDRVTGGLAQFDNDHFVVFRDSNAALLYANMLWSQIRDDEPPEVGADFP